MSEKGVLSRIIRANGDRHSLAADDGTNNPYGMPFVNAAPFHTTANPYGLAAQSSWPTAQTASSRQYGVIELFDDGETVSFNAKGFSSTNSAPTEVERYNMTLDFNLDSDNNQEWDAVYVGANPAEEVFVGFRSIWKLP